MGLSPKTIHGTAARRGIGGALAMGCADDGLRFAASGAEGFWLDAPDKQCGPVRKKADAFIRSFPERILVHDGRLSGVTMAAEAEAHPEWPAVNAPLDLFGPARVMWGAGGPSPSLAASSADWEGRSAELLGALGSAERSAVQGSAAARFLGLENANV